MKLVRNKKNGKMYEILFVATDKTNANDGGHMVVYKEDGVDNLYYTREITEFHEKFTSI